MHTHGPSCLEGPVTRDRTWWRLPVAARSPAVSRRLRRSPQSPIRRDLVDRIRQEIAEGTYDTPEKFDAALERLLDELESE